jgi:hypothetical protein
VVSCGGDKWTVNQWNYDEVPGGPSGAWNNDGACPLTTRTAIDHQPLDETAEPGNNPNN